MLGTIGKMIPANAAGFSTEGKKAAAFAALAYADQPRLRGIVRPPRTSLARDCARETTLRVLSGSPAIRISSKPFRIRADFTSNRRKMPFWKLTLQNAHPALAPDLQFLQARPRSGFRGIHGAEGH